MGRARVAVGALVLGGLVASCGRVSRGVAAGDAGAGAGGSASGAETPTEAGASGERTAPPDAAVTPSPCSPADAGAITWGETFEDTVKDSAVWSGAPQGLTRCGDGLCLLENTGLLMKLTSAGAPVWSRNIGGQSQTDLFAATSLAADASGNVVLGGYCTGQPALAAPGGTKSLSGCGSDATHPEIVVARFDASGLFISAETLGTSVNFPPAIRVAAEPDGRHAAFALAGGSANSYPSRTIVITWAADGAESYRRLFTGNSEPTDFAFDAQGNAVLVGFFYESTVFDESAPDGGTLLDTAGSRICVVKLMPKGELSWSRCFGGDPQPELRPTLALGPDDSIFLSGAFSRQLDFDAIGGQAGPSPTRLTTVGPSALPQPDFDLYVAKLTSDGDLVWQRGIGNSDDQQGIYGLAVTPEGHVILDATTRGGLDIGPFHIDADSSGNGFVLDLDGSGRPTFLTPLGHTRYLGAHNALLLSDCRDFYAAARFSGALGVPGTVANGNIFLVAGRY